VWAPHFHPNEPQNKTKHHNEGNADTDLLLVLHAKPKPVEKHEYQPCSFTVTVKASYKKKYPNKKVLIIFMTYRSPLSSELMTFLTIVLVTEEPRMAFSSI